MSNTDGFKLWFWCIYGCSIIKIFGSVFRRNKNALIYSAKAGDFLEGRLLGTKIFST